MSSTAELQALVDGLADRLDSPILLEDGQGMTVVYSPGQEHLDEIRTASILRREIPAAVNDWVTRLGVYASDEPVRVRLPHDIVPGHLGRIAVPVRYLGRSMGALWIVDDDERLEGPALEEAVRCAHQAALLMYNHELEVRLRAELLAHLLSPVDELRGAACQELAIQWRPRAYVLVTLHQLTGELDLGAAIGLMASRGAAGSVLAMARDDHLAVLLPDGRSDEPERETSRFISVLAKAGSVWVAGISEPHVRLGSAPLAYRQALLAARVASLTQPTSGVCSWDSLGAYTTLVQLPPDSIEQALDPRIIPLASEDYRDLLATAEAYLDGACDAARAAAQLHVHRGTVYYRLKQITAISGFDLDDGMDRLALHMAVKLLRMGPLTP